MRLTPARLALAISALLGLGALSPGLPRAAAGQARPAAPDDPLQAVADVVLIESECRQLAVDYGKLFAYAERNGISPVDVMPLGERRAAFDARYRRRQRERRGADLCGALAAARGAEIPGVFTAR